MNFVQSLTLGALVLTPTYAMGTESNKSPYFVDGVHCEGLDDASRDQDLATQYSDAVVAKMGIKAINQSICEQIYSEFGVEKFQWITPEDLERLSFGLKRSGRYKSVDIRIEKSELQNHVHLKGKFVQFEPGHYMTLNVQSAVENGQSSGNRTTTKTGGLFEFEKRGRNNPARFDVGFKTMHSSAAKPLSSDELKNDGTDSVLTEEEKAAQSKQSWQYQEIFTNLPLNAGYNRLPVSLRFGLNHSKLSKDETWDSNISMDMSTSYQMDYYLPVKYGLSLKYATYSVKGSDVVRKYSKDDPTTKRKSQNIVFAGISQEIDTRTIWGKINFNRSLTSELHYYYDFDIGFRLTEFAGFRHAIGVAADGVYGAILPEHRFGLPSRELNQFFYQADSKFSVMGSDNSLRLRLGEANLSAKKDDGYARRGGFAEVGLNTRTDHMDIGLSFIYGNQRLY